MKKEKKNAKKKLLVILVLALVVSMFTACNKAPDPTVKEGCFDFSVTYEVNGEQKTYTGVYVCKYDGVLTTFLSSGLEWTDYIENEEERDVPIETNEDGVIYINFGFFPEYFLNDPVAIYYEEPSSNLFMIYNDSNDEMTHITSEEEDILQYGVKIISYEYAEPIENTFEEKLTVSRFEPSIN